MSAMRRRWLRTVVGGTAVTVLSACGGSDGESVAARLQPTTVEPSSSTASTEGAPAAAATSTAAAGTGRGSTTTLARTADAGRPVTTVAVSSDDPLRRRDTPPGGVPAQLNFLAHTDGPCDPSHPTAAVEPASETYRIGDSVLVCTKGFDPAPPVQVELTLPDGRKRQRPVTNVVDQNYWHFPIGPTDPVGAYAITAVQGTKRAVGGFTAVLPTTPLIVTLGPMKGPPGTVFRFAVVSSSPRQTVAIDLYRSRAYATTPGSVTTDGLARGNYRLSTVADAPAGQYCLVARPFSNRCAYFDVG